MAIPAQTIAPGMLDSAFRREFDALVADGVPSRLWAKDSSLWPETRQKKLLAESVFGWLDLPVRMKTKLTELTTFAAEIERDGLCDIVNLGFSIPLAAPEVVAKAFPIPAGRRFFALDSTDPACVRAVDETIDLRKALFLVAGSSGKSIETHIHFLYFLDRLKTARVPNPGEHFAAIAEEGSYLDVLAGAYGFRKRFLDPHGLGGRYAVFSHFALVRAALWGLDLEGFVAAGEAMHRACGPGSPPERNPALALAALLAAGCNEGVGRLTLLSSSRIACLSDRIEQLIAASTGKQGRGILPDAGEADGELFPAATGAITVLLRLAGEEAPEMDRAAAQAKDSGRPVVESVLDSPLELGAEFFKWEAATLMVSVLLEVNPFEEPEARESEAKTAQLLESLQGKGGMPSATPRISEAGIELYAEGPTRHEISTLSLADALQTFFEACRDEDYLALLAFLPSNSNMGAKLHSLRKHMARGLGITVRVSFGPRYLSSLGQLYKGGPAIGRFLMLTAAHAEDIPIPGAGYTFGQFQMAQALGDLAALGKHEKPVLRLHFLEGAEQGLAQLERVVERALAHVRRARR